MAAIDLIQFYRGPATTLPIGADGEPLWTTDSHVLYVAQGGVNYRVGGFKRGVAARPPTYTDDATQGYEQGSAWFDTSAGTLPDLWFCIISAPGGAFWVKPAIAAVSPTPPAGGNPFSFYEDFFNLGNIPQQWMGV